MKQSKQKNVPFNTVIKEIECVVVENLSVQNDANSLCLGPLPCKQTKDEKRDACITSNPHYMEHENMPTFLQATVLKKRKKRVRKTPSFSVPLHTTNDKKKKDVAPIRYIQSSPNGTYILIYHMGSSAFALYQTIDILSDDRYIRMAML